jgi:hypothetical protein
MLDSSDDGSVIPFQPNQTIRLALEDVFQREFQQDHLPEGPPTTVGKLWCDFTTAWNDGARLRGQKDRLIVRPTITANTIIQSYGQVN